MFRSRKDEIFRGIFGAPHGVITIGSWRRPEVMRKALLEVTKRSHPISELPEELEKILDSKAIHQLALAALAPGAKEVPVALRAAQRAMKLPLGLFQTDLELRTMLERFAEELAKVKQVELAQIRENLAPFAFKRKEVVARREEKKAWIDASRMRARALPRMKKEDFDSLYDRVHGPYYKISGFTILPRKGCDLETLKAAIIEHHLGEGYQEGSQQGAKKTVRLVPAGDLFLSLGLHGDFWKQFSLNGTPVLETSNVEYWNEEAWEYRLWQNGSEIDRHASGPFLITQFAELLEEGDDPDMLKDLVYSWGGSALTLGRAFDVPPESISKYLVQFDPDELDLLLRDRKLFVSFKAREDDQYGLASPWVHLDLFGHLGVGERIREAEVSWPVEWGNKEMMTLYFRKPG